MLASELDDRQSTHTVGSRWQRRRSLRTSLSQCGSKRLHLKLFTWKQISRRAAKWQSKRMRMKQCSDSDQIPIWSLSDTGADGTDQWGLLIDHLDAPSVSVEIQVMLNVVTIFDKEFPSGTNILEQVVFVPVGQAGWLCQTCPIGTRRGQKRPLLVSWHKSYTHDGGLSLCHDTSSIPRWTLYLFHLSNLYHKVRLQDRGNVTLGKWIMEYSGY